MPTERLHLTDSLLLKFDARVLGVSTHQGARSLILDRTAFYPEAGGQLGDRGVIVRDEGTQVAIRDVQVDETGVVHHLVEGDASVPEGTLVRGTVNEAHRRDSMSQHTAQHMLSRAFFDAAGLETVSARLGSETSTIDLRSPTLDREVVAKVEQRVNEAVLEDRPVRVLFPTPSELAQLQLSKAPTVDRDIRVIEIDGFDAMPCGGTHCQRTGQVGPIVVTGQERYKGLTRVTFLAGLRSLRHFRASDTLLRDVTSALTCTSSELLTVVARLKDDAKGRAQALGRARAELARFLAQRLLAESPTGDGPRWIFVDREDEDIDALRALSSALAESPDVVAVVSSVAKGSTDRLIVIDRGASTSVDAGKWFKALAAAHAGRGGGRAEHAEGRIPATADWSAVRQQVR
jgi:alanyl-tRNA synthetase